MTKCDWCGKHESSATIKIGANAFHVCTKCLEAFKEKRCIDCGAPITLNRFQNGRCLKCAQVHNIREEKRELDESMSIDGLMCDGSENLDEHLYQAWMTGKKL